VTLYHAKVICFSRGSWKDKYRTGNCERHALTAFLSLVQETKSGRRTSNTVGMIASKQSRTRFTGIESSPKVPRCFEQNEPTHDSDILVEQMADLIAMNAIISGKLCLRMIYTTSAMCSRVEQSKELRRSCEVAGMFQKAEIDRTFPRQ